MTLFLDGLQKGDSVEIRGPSGPNAYEGRGILFFIVIYTICTYNNFCLSCSLHTMNIFGCHFMHYLGLFAIKTEKKAPKMPFVAKKLGLIAGGAGKSSVSRTKLINNKCNVVNVCFYCCL